jgi:hypothetical protein
MPMKSKKLSLRGFAALIPNNTAGEYECSVCARLFPESKPPQGRSQAETRLIERIHATREFSRHLCSPVGWTHKGKPESKDRKVRKADRRVHNRTALLTPEAHADSNGQAKEPSEGNGRSKGGT